MRSTRLRAWFEQVLPITAAMRTVAIESAPPVSHVFTEIADQVKIGVPIEVILDESSTKIGLPDFRFFTVAVGCNMRQEATSRRHWKFFPTLYASGAQCVSRPRPPPARSA